MAMAGVHRVLLAFVAGCVVQPVSTTSLQQRGSWPWDQILAATFGSVSTGFGEDSEDVNSTAGSSDAFLTKPAQKDKSSKKKHPVELRATKSNTKAPATQAQDDDTDDQATGDGSGVINVKLNSELQEASAVATKLGLLQTRFA